ncbi:selenocysteine lyase/cysteine desulfurase [Arthrobacter silviterrae]|uniref:Aminotransferase class V-fold PLP-dependent enzyme n=1 Tax=Arthrobacter silviterrae TaxID=2026658 RepID=A0ABX0DGR8_9MICC|nr:aminotransferase class V-fold PLP-dependent enzyme [Arthrobacter silviterrae]MDQ0277722.1 selenocysteine lyase/cysteine desulfurase [Arthrobacter silviterrae]NGN84966.1 aminotransferase class V-fold PLP-dependent enzyme [Arthrobacter silviterrae]
MQAPSSLPAGYLAAFREDEGYLNFASYGPPSVPVLETAAALMADAAQGAVGASGRLHAEDDHARAVFSRLSGFPLDSVALVPAASYGLFQLAFGTPGAVLVGAAEFPANVYPWLRAQQAGQLDVRLMGAPGVPVTPELVAAHLAPDVTAVAVSAVDFRTGRRTDLPALRELIGPERLLLVDAIQGFGAVEADWTVADAIVTGSQKWVRGGWGAGAMALSANALERIRPALGGWTGVENPTTYDAVEHSPRADALKHGVTNLSPFATGAFATALELVEETGLGRIAAHIQASAGFLIDSLDDAGVEVFSPRHVGQRAGIVVAGFPDGNAAEAHAALALAGITATLHGRHRIRLSPHATTGRETLTHAALVLAGFA